MRYLKLIGLGAWLLVIIWFEDTSDWSHEKLLLARRSFAVLMLFIIITSLFFSVKAFSSDADMEKRVDRIEVRQDRVYEELSNIKQRLAQVELTSRDSAGHIEKMVYGVVGLTFAVLGQLALGLFKYKMGND